MLARRRLSSRMAPVSNAVPQTKQTCYSRETCDLSCMTVLRLHGRNCPEPSPARRSASRQGSQTAARTQARKARPALDGENAVIRWRDTARPPIPTSNEHRDRQAERAGPQGPKALGIKAEWPRLAEAWGVAREPDGGTTGRPRVSVTRWHKWATMWLHFSRVCVHGKQ